MKIPSEAELIEMERDADRVQNFAERYEVLWGIAENMREMIALIRHIAPPAPIPPMAPRKRHKGLKAVQDAR